MRKNTITFTTAADLRLGFNYLSDGTCLIFKTLAKLFDAGAHRFPYAYFFILATIIGVPSVMSVMSARAERDAASKRAYRMEQKLDSMQVATDILNGKTFVYEK